MQTQERDNLLPQVQLKTVHRITRKASAPQPRLLGLEPGDGRGMGMNLNLYLASFAIKPSVVFWKSIWRRKKFSVLIFVLLTSTLRPIFTHFLKERRKKICVTLAIFWLWMICLFTYDCTRKWQKSRISKKRLYFVVSNLTVIFVGFSPLRSKMKADAINDLQYRRANMVTNSDMFVN